MFGQIAVAIFAPIISLLMTAAVVGTAGAFGLGLFIGWLVL
jgi:hypothetical protein